MVIRTTSAQQMAFSLPEPVRTWDAPPEWKAPESLPELHGFVALDLETKDLGITRGTGSSWAIKGEGFICGAALAAEGLLGYAPIAHAAGNMDPLLFWTWLRKQASKPDVTFVMANSIYDAGWLARHDITPANAPADVQAMAYLLDEHRRSYSLSNLAKEFLGEDKTTGTLLDEAKKLHIAHPMSNMDKLPAWTVAPYGISDAVLTWKLYHHLLPMLERDGLMRVHDLERESAMVAVDMRKLGVRIDMDRVEQVKRQFESFRDANLKLIQDITNVPVAPFDMDSCVRALRAENAGVVLGTTATGRDSVAKDVLFHLGTPISSAILKARQYEKAIGTFLDGGLLKYANAGRIHAEFNMTRGETDQGDAFSEIGGTVTGRVSCRNPNLQQIPIRDPDIGPPIRSCFLPEEGERWVSSDFSSQEPRWTVHYAALMNLRGSDEMVERFRDNARTDLHAETARIMGVPRSQAKTINLGLAYGMGSAKLCHSLGLPTRYITSRSGMQIEVAGLEGEELLRRHAASVPYIKLLSDATKDRAEDRGYLVSALGRRVRFEERGQGNYWQTHKSLNKLIQSSAATQNKVALVGLRAEKIPVLLTIHDSVEYSVPTGPEGDEIIRRVETCMVEALVLEVPSVVDTKTGNDWGSLA